jgi:hypothetical protein
MAWQLHWQHLQHDSKKHNMTVVLMGLSGLLTGC